MEQPSRRTFSQTPKRGGPGDRDAAEGVTRLRALREATLPAGQAFLTRKELVELYTRRMGTPERALPELAKLAEEMTGTPEGEWAASQLREIKARMS